MKAFDAVAFDIDGTLYPNHRAVFALMPHALRNLRLVNAFRKARRILRQERIEGQFFDRQAVIIAKLLGEDTQDVKRKIEQLIYRDWCDAFKRIKPFRYVRETIELIRQAGCKTGAMSDFPPHEKLVNLKLDGIWDVMIGSEFTGRLKPDPRPFLRLAEALDAPPGRVLYVGNSVKYDVCGAKKTGMKTALIEVVPSFRGKGGADFVFRDYRQLQRFLLLSPL
ncbi:MAG: HAD family hydrolase [Spirochaetaceae bacterium]|jgi:putative hydrolase of the HAD superfamily|nr:HAD family hydrolase [Spirochaetaceae bacterium]